MSNPKTILIIDDEEDLRDTVEYKFKSKGFKTATAVDGLDGLEKCDIVKPDLIILDMNMPRMNGLEFYEKIKGSNDRPKYPVLVLTARANMEQLFTELDVDGFMSKPFDLDELVKEGENIIKQNVGSVSSNTGVRETRSRKICIIDPDQEICNNLSLSFLDAGYTVSTAHSGTSAIKRISMDLPDVAIVRLEQKDIAGDVAILKCKNNEKTKAIKFILYTEISADKAAITERISEKSGINTFVQSTASSDLMAAVESLF